MSRLDAFIRRLQAQRSCIDAVAAKLPNLKAPVLELGLGNGRTYDHLRVRFPQSEIFVFDREIAAHPECIPPHRLCRLGDFRTTVPEYFLEDRPSAAFIHADIGSSNKEASILLAADLAPTLGKILMLGGYLACDQPVIAGCLEQLPLPDGLEEGRYNFYQRAF